MITSTNTVFSQMWNLRDARPAPCVQQNPALQRMGGDGRAAQGSRARRGALARWCRRVGGDVPCLPRVQGAIAPSFSALSNVGERTDIFPSVRRRRRRCRVLQKCPGSCEDAPCVQRRWCERLGNRDYREACYLSAAY